MNGWRRDICLIREALTATPSGGWRADLRAIAGGGQGWRDSIRLWAQSYGVSDTGWRGDIAGIAAALGMSPTSDWRENLRYIRENFAPGQVEPSEPEPEQAFRFLTQDGIQFTTADGSRFMVGSA